MNQFSKFPFVRYSLFLIFGIILYKIYQFYAWELILIFPILLIFYYFSKNLFKNKILTGFAGLLILIFTGYIISYQNDDSQKAQFFGKSLKENTHLLIKTKAFVEEKSKFWKTVADVEYEISGKTAKKKSGKILLYLDRNEFPKPAFGDEYILLENPTEIESPKNFDEFDYKSYLANLGVYHQIFAKTKNIRFLRNKSDFNITKFALEINYWADSLLTNNIPNKQEYGVAIAMILGQRDDINSELMNAYASAGAIHVLSVSGLHVGIIYLILQFCFAFLKKKGNVGKIAFVIIILTCLWFYALLTGLSSPVLRSALMFSLITLANIFNKNQNSYNTVAFSAFCLLLYEPKFLYQIGFQLTYSAVFGMIYFQEPLMKLFLFNLRNPILAKVYHRFAQVTGVAISATISTFPLSVYSFHQFPNPIYFLIANPIVIITSSLCLAIGLGYLLICGFINFLGIISINKILGLLVYWVFKILNEIMLFIDKLPKASLQYLNISKLELIAFYLLIFTIIALRESQKYIYVKISIFTLLFLITWNVYDRISQNNNQFLVIHFSKKHPALSHCAKEKSLLIADSNFINNKNLVRYTLNNFYAKSQFLGINQQKLKTTEHSVFGIKLANLSILWINCNLENSKTIPSVQSVDYLILGEKTLKHYKKIINQLKFRTLILEPSYKKKEIAAIEHEIQAMGKKCLDMNKTGAIRIDDDASIKFANFENY